VQKMLPLCTHTHTHTHTRAHARTRTHTHTHAHTRTHTHTHGHRTASVVGSITSAASATVPFEVQAHCTCLQFFAAVTKPLPHRAKDMLELSLVAENTFISCLCVSRETCLYNSQSSCVRVRLMRVARPATQPVHLPTINRESLEVTTEFFAY